MKGGVWLQGGYATEPLRTGDSIVSVASSASVLYYSKTVTYADNTKEEEEIKAGHAAGRGGLYRKIHTGEGRGMYGLPEMADGSAEKRGICDTAGLYAGEIGVL